MERHKFLHNQIPPALWLLFLCFMWPVRIQIFYCHWCQVQE